MSLPDYIVIDDESIPQARRDILRTVTTDISFPLSSDDRHVIDMLKAKLDAEEFGVGLAANQIGFSRRVAILAVADTQEMRDWRLDYSEPFPRTVLINPRYTPVGAEKNRDYECCISVGSFVGVVPRYKKIHLTAWLESGEKMDREFEGFLARALQHEIDHLDGKLFIDYIQGEKTLTIPEYQEIRAKAMRGGGRPELKSG